MGPLRAARLALIRRRWPHYERSMVIEHDADWGGRRHVVAADASVREEGHYAIPSEGARRTRTRNSAARARRLGDDGIAATRWPRANLDRTG